MSKSEGERLTPAEMQQRGLALRTVGWTLLVFDAIVALFIFVGFRTGSYLWFFWTVIEGAAGIGLIVLGLRSEENAGSLIGHLAEPHVQAGEMPADEEPRLAA